MRAPAANHNNLLVALVSEMIALACGGTKLRDLISRVIAESTACIGVPLEQVGHIHSYGSI